MRLAFSIFLGILDGMGGAYFRLRYAYAAMFALLIAERLISVALSSTFEIQRQGMFLADIAVVPVLVLWVLHVPIWSVLSRKPQPTRYIFETYKSNVLWFLCVGALFVFSWLKAANVAKIKTAIPQVVPYYADPFLAELDRAIFLIDPWRITHFFIGDWGTGIVDDIYIAWHFVQICFGCWMIVTRNLRLQTTALISYTLCWILLGGVGAMLFSSVGPCFYEQFYGATDFRPLMQNLIHAPISAEAQKYLLDSFDTGNLGSGISAFPSMHVAIAVWEALVVRMAFRNRILTAAAWAWVFVICVGSVHLGWHYAVDGIFAAAGAVCFWKVAQWIVAYNPRSSRSAGETGAVLQQ
jgi:hypothetical protein